MHKIDLAGSYVNSLEVFVPRLLKFCEDCYKNRSIILKLGSLLNFVTASLFKGLISIFCVLVLGYSSRSVTCQFLVYSICNALNFFCMVSFKVSVAPCLIRAVAKCALRTTETNCCFGILMSLSIFLHRCYERGGLRRYPVSLRIF